LIAQGYKKTTSKYIPQKECSPAYSLKMVFACAKPKSLRWVVEAMQQENILPDSNLKKLSLLILITNNF